MAAMRDFTMLVLAILVFNIASASSTTEKDNKSVLSLFRRQALLRAMMDASPFAARHNGGKRVKRGAYKKKDWKNHPLFPLYPIDMHACEDSRRESKYGLCATWAKAGFCVKVKHIMKRYCRKTCRMCKAPAPPKCDSSRFGCCWDRRFAARGPNGEGCPPCFDMYPHTCRQFLDYCDRRGRSGRFIRYHCFSRCGACGPRSQLHKN